MSSNVLCCQQPKDIHSTVIKEEKRKYLHLRRWNQRNRWTIKIVNNNEFDNN